MKRLVLPICAAIAVAGGLAMPAKADILYQFSVNLSSGAVLGTLTGTLDLPFVNAGGSGSGAASSLIFTSIPPGFGALAGGNTATNWADQVANSFTVVAGVITSDAFFALTGGSDPADLLCLNSTGSSAGSFGAFGCPSQINELHTAAGVFGFNSGGLAGVTFTPLASAPEPGTVALLSAGLLGLFGLSRRKFSRNR